MLANQQHSLPPQPLSQYANLHISAKQEPDAYIEPGIFTERARYDCDCKAES